MCEYCGCQAIAAIEQLTDEHDQMLGHVRAAEQAVQRADRAGAVRACQQLQVLLVPHTRTEEQGLFPPMAAEFGEQLQQLEDEHADIEQVVSAMIEGTIAGSCWTAELQRAMSVLRGHIRKEQDGVFPAALTILRAADWARLDEARGQEPAPAVLVARLS